jgi:hypothetical protein
MTFCQLAIRCRFQLIRFVFARAVNCHSVIGEGADRSRFPGVFEQGNPLQDYAGTVQTGEPIHFTERDSRDNQPNGSFKASILASVTSDLAYRTLFALSSNDRRRFVVEVELSSRRAFALPGFALSTQKGFELGSAGLQLSIYLRHER